MWKLGFALMVAVATVPTGVAAQGTKWTPVSFGGTPQVTQVYFIDRASIVRSGKAASFYALVIYRTPSDRGVDRVIEPTRADCSDRSSRATGAVFLNGSTVVSRMGEQKEVERYPAGTPWRILLDSVSDNDLPSVATNDPKGWAQQRYFSK